MMRLIGREQTSIRARRPRGPGWVGLWLAVLVVGLGGSGGGGGLWAQERERGIGVGPPETATTSELASIKPKPVKIEGPYWAVLIGIDEYANAENLQGAVKDVMAVESVLTDRYGFAPGHVTRLLNGEATRTKIVDTLFFMKHKAGPNDSVFIYYAGHGQSDGDVGWWVPADGYPKKPGTLIRNAEVRNYIKDMKARHVYVVADACFSGSLFAKRSLPPINDRYYATLYEKRSRWGLSSGADEPVADQGLEGHSPFAWFFLETLRENKSPYLLPSEIHTALAKKVAGFVEQTPLSEPLQNSRHAGGQFVFRLARTTTPATGGAEPAPDFGTPPPTTDAVTTTEMGAEKWRGMLESLRKL